MLIFFGTEREFEPCIQKMSKVMKLLVIIISFNRNYIRNLLINEGLVFHFIISTQFQYLWQ